jgi:hypothetical protein
MKDLYDYLVKNKVSPNGLFVLHCSFNNYMYPSYVNFKTEQYRLETTGHLVKENTGVNEIYKITLTGEHLLKECEHILNKAKRAKKNPIALAEWDEKIAEYNQIFPAGKKSGTSLAFRTNPKELVAAFVWFFKEYPEYSWEDVLNATRKYVQPFEETSEYTYMQTSRYFVKKDDKSKNTISTLAGICYNIAEGNDEDISETGFHYFGP